ncbi:hypothetical protein AXG93_2016s1330 [Marchantia polymorpha subsp. ruderalis]|uniref:Uncharacterized protein n=1 Tax=Marchantia polymorpha subsp. ruderalis TaxID=1480154 RepID=A0A176VV88_MARPO|nr:hypothetical protein AXG93_2016s1330 [Marchantia polymorpha subsp. ruderalis]
MAAAKKELQQQLETQVSALSKIQKDITKNHQVRRQYTIQHGENEMVQKLSSGYTVASQVLFESGLGDCEDIEPLYPRTPTFVFTVTKSLDVLLCMIYGLFGHIESSAVCRF